MSGNSNQKKVIPIYKSEEIKDSDEINFKQFKKEAIQQLLKGKPLSGKDGVLTPLIKNFLEEAIEAEFEQHLGYDKNQRSKNPNYRNGRSKKTVKSKYGDFELETPRDRESSFEPEIVKKRETVLLKGLDDKILSMWALGTSYNDIADHIKDMYGLELSPSTFTAITDKVTPMINEWQSRQLDEVYPFIWMDALVFKVKEDHKIEKKAAHVIIGLDQRGRKDVLGIYYNKTEGANFWLEVLTDLRNRGVKDILIACIDNLKGFSEAIESIYSETEVQLCVIHQIRNSLKYVASKNQKEFMKDLKLVYKATTKELAEQNLLELDEKWGSKYPLVIKSWTNNWDRLSTYFKYPEEIRKMIYTTNIIEGFNRQIRKVTKTKGVFTNEMALKKLVYLATQNIMKKWTHPRQNWSSTIGQLSIIFGDRVKLDLNL